MSNPSQQPMLYDPNTDEFAHAGRAKLREVFEQNHYPSRETIKKLSEETGASFRKCQSKIRSLRSNHTRRLKVIAVSSADKTSVTPVAPVATVSSVVPFELSNPHLFLNRISKEFLETLYSKMVSHDLLPHIRPKNLVYITIDQLKALKSSTEKDGNFIYDWLSCQLHPQDIAKPPQRHPKIALHDFDKGKTITCKKFITEKTTILWELNIKMIALYQHHIVLRRKKSSMPVLMVSEANTSVSHLCDTVGCLRPDHIIEESFTANKSRQKCTGMIIAIRNDMITGMVPCRHGIEGGTLTGDPFESTCRKVRAIFHSPQACAFIDSLQS